MSFIDKIALSKVFASISSYAVNAQEQLRQKYKNYKTRIDTLVADAESLKNEVPEIEEIISNTNENMKVSLNVIAKIVPDETVQLYKDYYNNVLARTVCKDSFDLDAMAKEEYSGSNLCRRTGGEEIEFLLYNFHIYGNDHHIKGYHQIFIGIADNELLPIEGLSTSGLSWILANRIYVPGKESKWLGLFSGTINELDEMLKESQSN